MLSSKKALTLLVIAFLGMLSPSVGAFSFIVLSKFAWTKEPNAPLPQGTARPAIEAPYAAGPGCRRATAASWARTLTALVPTGAVTFLLTRDVGIKISAQLLRDIILY